jgi:hypothetical protein
LGKTVKISFLFFWSWPLPCKRYSFSKRSSM